MSKRIMIALVGDEILEDAWDTARRLAEDEPDRISRVYEAQMETGLAHLAQHMLVDDVDTSSLRRRVPFKSLENLVRLHRKES